MSGKYRNILFRNRPTFFSRKIAEKLGCKTEANSEELLSCFREVKTILFDQGNEMIIFVSILTTFEANSIFKAA